MEEEAIRQPSFGVGDYIGFAESLKERCRRLDSVHGIGKLERKIHAELKFLNTLKERHREAHPSHLHSSNLCHFASIVHAAEELPGVVCVLKPVRSPGRGKGSLVVDVVACQGHHWVKVIARKGQALHLIWAGQGQFGERDLVTQAEDYLHASDHNQYLFLPPKVHVVFYNQVTFPMAEALSSQGIFVWGQRVKVHDDVMYKLTSVLALDDTYEEEEEEEEEDDDNWNDDDTVNDNKDNTKPRTLGISVDGGIDRNSNDDVTGQQGSIAKRIILDGEHAQGPSHLHLDDSFKPSNIDNTNDKAIESSQPNLPSNHTLLNAQSSPPNPPKSFHSVCGLPNVPHEISPLCDISSSSSSCGGSVNTSCTTSREFSIPITKNSDAEYPTETPPTQSFETSTNPRSNSNNNNKSNNSFPEPPTNNACAATPTLPADIHIHPYDALFRCIVISPPNYCSFPSYYPTDNNTNPQCLQTASPPLHSGDASAAPSTSSATRSTTAAAASAIAASSPTRVNLDITSLITLVSNVTHGHCHLVFKEKVLAFQAMEERRAPCLPPLQSYLQDKMLYACQTAVDSFQGILDVLGGPREKDRAARLLSGVTVVPDELSPRAHRLETQGKIKERSKIVFGTGDFLKAITVTSNTGFVRAARHQGVEFPVFTHPARALTEEKEKTATPL